MRVVFEKAARDDVNQAWVWYAERSLNAADDFEAELRRLTVLLRDMGPEIAPKVDGFGGRLRRLVFQAGFPYTLILRDGRDPVVIIAVAHTSRNFGFWRDRV
jgi:plasmid stabilization system protein ParE